MQVVAQWVTNVVDVLRDFTTADRTDPRIVLLEELYDPSPLASTTRRSDVRRRRHNISSPGTFHPKRMCPPNQIQKTMKDLGNVRTVALNVGVP